MLPQAKPEDVEPDMPKPEVVEPDMPKPEVEPEIGLEVVKPDIGLEAGPEIGLEVMGSSLVPAVVVGGLGDVELDC